MDVNLEPPRRYTDIQSTIFIRMILLLSIYAKRQLFPITKHRNSYSLSKNSVYVCVCVNIHSVYNIQRLHNASRLHARRN